MEHDIVRVVWVGLHPVTLAKRCCILTVQKIKILRVDGLALTGGSPATFLGESAKTVFAPVYEEDPLVNQRARVANA